MKERNNRNTRRQPGANRSTVREVFRILLIAVAGLLTGTAVFWGMRLVRGIQPKSKLPAAVSETVEETEGAGETRTSQAIPSLENEEAAAEKADSETAETEGALQQEAIPDPDGTETAATEGAFQQKANSKPDGTETAEEMQEDLLEQRVEEIFANLTLKQRLAQIFITSPEFLTGVPTVLQAGPSTKDAISNYPVGGLIYGEKNLLGTEQVKEMLSNTQAYLDEEIGLPALLCIEEGGGYENNCGRLLGMSNGSIEAGKTDQAKFNGYNAGTAMTELGFNVDLAPSAGIGTGGASEGNTSLGTDPKSVSEMCTAFLEGLHSGSQGTVAGCMKYFPCEAEIIDGAYVPNDSTEQELYEEEWLPFRKAIDSGVQIIMVGHTALVNVAGREPSSLSSIVITEMLRGKLGFDGLVIAESLNEKEIIEKYNLCDAVVQSINAGADMVIVTKYFDIVYNSVLNQVGKELNQERFDDAVKRIIRYKLQMEQAGTAETAVPADVQ